MSWMKQGVYGVSSKRNRVHKEAISVGAKWTVLQPERREKHFVVHSRVERADGPIETVRLEALLTKAVYEITVSELSDVAHWRSGWH